MTYQTETRRGFAALGSPTETATFMPVAALPSTVFAGNRIDRELPE
jgi:hypothetical protein